MKKRVKSEPDIAGLILKVQQQLTFLDKKIDALISQPPKPFQRFEGPHRQGEGAPGAGYRERTMHKAICADCHKECQVPFRPTGNRPVYCKECFSKRKTGGTFRKEVFAEETKKPAPRRRQKRPVKINSR